ncbi:MAG: proton-conducting membrane transporter, partial [Lachnospiraceae bacterium]|nr:proton-conducting membrane transporter [Lachnospiraceae bacterium]
EVNGVGRRMPLTFGFYTLGALSLTGIPMFCGFISKWRLLLAGAASGTMVGVIGDVCLIVAAFLCATYTLSISIRAFFPVRGTDGYPSGLKEAGWRMLVPIGFFAFLKILFGHWAGPVMDFISRISSGFI